MTALANSEKSQRGKAVTIRDKQRPVGRTLRGRGPELLALLAGLTVWTGLILVAYGSVNGEVCGFVGSEAEGLQGQVTGERRGFPPRLRCLADGQVFHETYAPSWWLLGWLLSIVAVVLGYATWLRRRR